MLIKILIALAGIVFVFVAIVATRPSEYRVTRTATISAPAPAVFAQVNDFHKWQAWIFLDLDKMIGGNFEKWLADMKSVVEGAAKPS
jgi:hypothetical protein